MFEKEVHKINSNSFLLKEGESSFMNFVLRYVIFYSIVVECYSLFFLFIYLLKL